MIASFICDNWINLEIDKDKKEDLTYIPILIYEIGNKEEIYIELINKIEDYINNLRMYL